MTQWYPDEQIREWATMPADSPDRRSLEARLLGANYIEREYWQGFIRQTDWLYNAIAKIVVPATLEARLLHIADAPASAAAWNRPVVYRLAASWKWVAALLLIGLAARNYLVWDAPLPRDLPLKNAVAMNLAQEAIQYDRSAPPLSVTGNDPAAVQTALTAHGFAFPVMVLHPQAAVSLVGGGACDFRGTPAAFTRWQDKSGLTYTVFQFDGTPLGVPAEFKTTAEAPQDLWQGAAHYRVVIWSGKVGKCTWALVMDSDDAKDVFSNCVY